jgi:diguanylate cyclase (GGDEF)-like protein
VPARPPRSRLEPRPALRDPLAQSRRRLLLGLFLVGLLASLSALLVQGLAVSALDRVALPLLALAFGGMGLALWRRLVSSDAVARFGYFLLAAYMLANLNEQLLGAAQLRQGLNESSYWFAVVYCSAFVVWDGRAALRAAILTFALALLSGAGHLASQLLHLHWFGPAPRHHFGAPLLAYAGQFYLSGLAAILLLSHITRIRERYGEARAMALNDALTGLPNRRMGEQMLDEACAASPPLVVVIFDIDHFKAVNDRYGHAAGDQVLREAARLVTGRVPTGGHAARWGGEEFLLLLPGFDLARAVRLAERLRQDIEAHDFERVGRVTASFGVAGRRAGDSPERLLRRADRMLYRAKAQGRNRVKLPTMF